MALLLEGIDYNFSDLDSRHILWYANYTIAEISDTLFVASHTDGVVLSK